MFCAPSVSLSVRARLRWNTQFNGEPVPLAPYTYFNQLNGMRGLHHAPKQAKSQILGPCVYSICCKRQNARSVRVISSSLRIGV